MGHISENDLYTSYQDDRYYTNGFFFNFNHALKRRGGLPDIEKKILSLELGHKIYTPFSATLPDPAEHDRPFTAYLYAGAGMNWFFSSESHFKLMARLGVMGPAAGGYELQSGMHRLLGIYKVQGWKYQLKNEVGLNLQLDYNRLLTRTSNDRFDITASPSVWFGNTFTGAEMSAIFRFGKLNKMYQSASWNSETGNFSQNGKTSKEFFFYTKPAIDFVVYNATIQGGLFREDKGPVTFGIKNVVISQQVGVSFSSDRWTASYFAIFKSKEVESKATAYQYGSLGLFYRFN